MFADWISATQTNHGLKHATIAVLIEKCGMQTIAGRASNDGFYVLGHVDTAIDDNGTTWIIWQKKRNYQIQF